MATRFAEWMKKNRLNQGLSLQQFADRLGGTKDTVFRLERGSPETPPAQTVMAVANVLGRPLGEALEMLGYELPKNVDRRIEQNLADAVSHLSIPGQQRLAELLPSLMAMAQEVTQPLLRAAEPPAPYRKDKRKKKDGLD